MRLTTLATAFVILSALPQMAWAELVNSHEGPPQFSAADVALIARNALLNGIVTHDPWLVRRILDLRSSAEVVAPVSAEENSRWPDLATNPDFITTRRDASGSVEWIALLRRARAERDAVALGGDRTNTRSSESSVELIELMRRAKTLKENK